MNYSKINFCPYCGKRIAKVNTLDLNFCYLCGKKLNKLYEHSLKKVSCIVCHKYIDQEKIQAIKCSYCESQFHAKCITSWLMKYNSCPLCLNVYIMPKISPIYTR
ncbi:MAG: RING finger domain-containing protein [Promethearchaeota archaeon]